jgi:UDP-N-acetylmuramoyl-tripeptide--D-alanyl-D-alanine ligase
VLNTTAINSFLQLSGASPEVIAGITGVAVDSRILQLKNLFFALPGAQVDGHQYISAAAAKGASAAVVRYDYKGPEDMPLIRVACPFTLLQDWAKAVIAASNATIVAVTGSVGKTTTKHFIAHLVSEKYRTSVSPGNSNSQIGLPLAILNHTQGNEQVLILEMGMTSRGEIARLVEIAPPDISVLTAVALVHALNFDDLADISRSKAEILGHPRTRLGIVHQDVKKFEAISAHTGCPLLSFSWANPQADYSAIEHEKGITLRHEGIEVADLVSLPFPGKHNRQNYLAAVAVAKELGLTWEEIIKRSATLSLPQKRMQFIEKEGILFIDDSYNAAPISMQAAIDSVPKAKDRGRRIAVLGAMLELGELSEHYHSMIGTYAIDRLDLLFCLGEECAPMEQAWVAAGRSVQRFSERCDLAKALRNELRRGDVVLIKGSLGTQIYKLIEEI